MESMMILDVPPTGAFGYALNGVPIGIGGTMNQRVNDEFASTSHRRIPPFNAQPIGAGGRGDQPYGQR